jgi:putative GTP pyrophosphokinase
VSYSKSQVNRAGQLLVDHLSAAAGSRRIGRQRAELTEAIEILDWWRGEHAKPLSRVAANLRAYAADEGEPVITQRLKRLPTMVGKLLRTPGMKLARMEDIGGVRAVLPNQDVAYRVAGRLRKNWTITRFRDYAAEPKADGYRALHLINRNHGRLIEVQLRTRLQDAWANSVEIDSRRVAPNLKFGAGPRELRDFYLVLGEFLAIADQDLPPDSALYRRIMELRGPVDTLRRRARQRKGSK